MSPFVSFRELSGMAMPASALRDSVVNGGIKYLSNKVVLICLLSLYCLLLFLDSDRYHIRNSVDQF